MQTKIYIRIFFLVLIQLTTLISYSQNMDTHQANGVKLQALKGDIESQYILGIMYLKGQGVNKNIVESLKWLKKAATQGNLKAQEILSQMYQEGIGVDKDTSEAFKWNLMSAEQGDLKAQKNLGIRFFLGEGVAKNEIEGIKWFKKAAENGDPYCQTKLGHIYYNGEVISKNLSDAINWWSLAAQQNFPEAQLMLGLLSFNGEGLPLNYNNALIWFLKAAENGNIEAQYRAGYMYLNGYGIDKNLELGTYWLERAASQGQQDAILALNKNKEYDLPVSLVDDNIPQNVNNNQSTTFAIIIGNEDYDKVSQVPFAKRDVKTLEKYLIYALGLPKDHVLSIENASFGNMRAAVKQMENLSQAFGDNLNLIFYYAGHGAPNEKTKNAMLIPTDGDAAIPETCFDLDNLYTQLSRLEANSIVVMMDACFSGSIRGEGMLTSARSIKIKPNMNEPKGSLIIISAAQGDETAYPYEQEQHGMFTYFLLKKLQEKEGNVTLGELADYIVERVKQQSVVTNGKLQTPSISISPKMEDKWRDLKFGN